MSRRLAAALIGGVAAIGALSGLLVACDNDGTSSTDGASAVPSSAIDSAETMEPANEAEEDRTDCPDDWEVYADSDGRFSICYPPAVDSVVSPPDADQSPALELTVEPGVSLTIYSRPVSYFTEESGLTPCEVAPAWEDAEETEVELAGMLVPVCRGFETLLSEDSPPIVATFAELPAEESGYVNVFTAESQSPDSESSRALLTEILDTLSVAPV